MSSTANTMDESEFVVVSDEHNPEVKIAVQRLKEVEQSYRAAHGISDAYVMIFPLRCSCEV